MTNSCYKIVYRISSAFTHTREVGVLAYVKNVLFKFRNRKCRFITSYLGIWLFSWKVHYVIDF